MSMNDEAMPEGYFRLSVLINDESAAVLRRVKDQRGWSATECVRVAIGLLDRLEAAREANGGAS